VLLIKLHPKNVIEEGRKEGRVTNEREERWRVVDCNFYS